MRLSLDPSSFDVEALWDKCRRYLRRVGSYDDDVLSEMILIAIERMDKGWQGNIKIKYLFLGAYNRIHPNMQVNKQKIRKESFVTSWEDIDRASDPVAKSSPSLDNLPFKLPESGPIRAMLILRIFYKYKQQEIALMFGCTQAYVTQLTRLSNVPAFLDDVVDILDFNDLDINIRWLTL